MAHERYLPERLPQAAQQACEGTVIATAEGIARGCHEAIRPDQAREFAAEIRPADRRAGYFAVNRIVRPLEDEALRAWASTRHLLLETLDFDRKWREQGCKGESEHEIYFDPSLERWFKRNNLSNHGNWLEYFHRLALHNWLFPEAPLRLEGFMIVGALFLPVVSQAHVVSLDSSLSDRTILPANMITSVQQLELRSTICMTKMCSSTQKGTSSLSIRCRCWSRNPSSGDWLPRPSS